MGSVYRETAPFAYLLCVVACAVGCSADTTPRKGAVEPAPQRAAGAGGSSAGVSNPAVISSSAGSAAPTGVVTPQTKGSEPLGTHVEDRAGLKIDVVAIACHDDCVDVKAVATGGNPEYAFAWDDGVDTAMRQVCVDDSKLTVTVKDTPITSQEFGYEGATASVSVTTRQLECPVDGGAPPPPPPTAGGFCLKNPSLEGGTFPGMPPDWAACANTPDVGPVGLGVAASDGTSYVGGAASASALTAETFAGTLCNPLTANEPASFLIDLSMSTAWGNPGLAALQIWGASTSCGNDEMLWASPKLENLDMWKTFCVTITPSKEYSSIVMVPTTAGGDPATSAQGGYVVVDNIRPTNSCN
jgi:mRNA-degrading endonuclease toxin of MazEF toxin-antitoxin module